MRRNPNRDLTKRQLRRVRSRELRLRGVRETSEFALLGRWVILIGTVVLATLTAAAYFTPMFAINQLEIIGTDRVSAEKVQAKLKPVVGRLLTQVTEPEVAKLLAEFDLIDTISLESRPPDTLVVRIQERQPIARVRVNGQEFLFDAAGVKIGEVQSSDDFPKLLGIGNPSSSDKYREAVETILQMPQSLYRQLESVEMDGSVALIRLEGVDLEIVWGDPTQAALKAEVLGSILDSLDDSVSFIDVSSPMAPVVKY